MPDSPSAIRRAVQSLSPGSAPTSRLAREDGASPSFQPSRRALLAGGGAVALFAIGGRAVRALEAPKVEASAWRDLERHLSGALLRPGSDAFVKAALPYNLTYADRQPAAIARCRSEEDVAAAISWCRQTGVPLAARGGGHNYAGYSTTTGLLIDLSGLNRLSFDRDTGRLAIGAGVRNSHIRDGLGRTGATIVHGRCASVGAAGFLLGGGIGFDMRLKGVGSDLMVASRMVDAKGTLRALSATDNADAFWACRGGAGGNFGINTWFELATFPVGALTVFRLRWSEPLEEVLAALLPALQAAPDRLGSRLSITAGRADGTAGPNLHLLGQIHGSRDEAMDILRPAIAAARPAHLRVETMDYWAGQDVLNEEAEHEYVRERSRFLDQTPGGEAIARLLACARTFPGASAVGTLKLFQTGGATNAMPAGSTAFVHRTSQWLLSIAHAWTVAETPAAVAAGRDWLDASYEALLPFCGAGAFQNFPDPGLADWAQCYYGANLPRLRQVKARLDPDELFRFPQSIRPAAR